MGLDGVEIFLNSSGSHHELRKLDRRVNIITETTMKVSSYHVCIAELIRQLGGIYLYSNQIGCDGDRLYYDGASMIAMNGRILARAPQFSLSDVEVISATIDLEAVRAHRTSSSRRMQAAASENFEQIPVAARLDGGVEVRPGVEETQAREWQYHLPEEEIASAFRNRT